MANGADRPGGCVRVGTWNVQWAKPGLRKAPLLAEVLAAPDCDILAVTEGDAGILPKGGHVIDAGTDWGYPLPKASPGRRKVLLWSRRPWTPVFDTLAGRTAWRQVGCGRDGDARRRGDCGWRLHSVGWRACEQWSARPSAVAGSPWIGSVDSSDCPTRDHEGGRLSSATSTSAPQKEANSIVRCRRPLRVSESRLPGSWPRRRLRLARASLNCGRSH